MAPRQSHEADEGALPLHVLEYYWEEFEPHMLCHDSRSSELLELDLKEVRFRASRQKTCIGCWDDEGRYIPCPTNEQVTRFNQCPRCSEKFFLPYQECLFDPKCDGGECGLEFCSREHMLYVAFYDTRMKVGMSSSKRVERRLIEQGADAFSIIGRFQGRRKAREAEKAISSRLGIPQFHRQDVLLRSLSRPLDVKGIEGRYEGLRMTLRGHFGLSPDPIRWLKGYPIDLPLSGVPKLTPSWGEHRGEYVGVKGKWIIFEAGGLRALNLSDLPGRHVARQVA